MGLDNLVLYTVWRFAAGFLSASVIAVCIGILIGCRDRCIKP